MRRNPTEASPSGARRVRGGERGFSLVELLVALLIAVQLGTLILILFTSNDRVARIQMQLAEMQQAQRVAQYDLTRTVRMASRGGIQGIAENPVDNSVVQIGVAVRNNVGDEEQILTAGAFADDSPLVVPGTDVLTVRGVLDGLIYQVNSTDPNTFTYDPTEGTGTLTIRSISPTGVPQSTEALEELIADEVGDALVLVSAVSDVTYTVVEIDPDNSLVGEDDAFDPPVTVVTLAFRAKGSDRSAAYQTLHPRGIEILEPGAGGGAPLSTVVYAGLVEEYRYYVRQLEETESRPGSDIVSRLSRARVFPGTEIPYREDLANLRDDIADNILDLQVALGIDVDGDGQLVEGIDDDTKAADEWLFNVADDEPFAGELSLVRITTLARTDRPDRQYFAPPLLAVEDRSFAEDPLNTSRTERLYRRRLLESTVDIRNRF
jgi:prepilin-type N-terminal cleavage/methylation domain-containing protein